MSPQEAAEYLAKIGGGYALLRQSRKLIKELDDVDKEAIDGLLSAFLGVISSVAESLQIFFDQLSDAAELQEAVVHGDDEGRSNRHRLKL